MAGKLEQGREAFERRAWAAARDALLAAHDVDSLEPVDLQRLATAAYLVGDGDLFLRSLEEAHHANLERDALAPAVRAAFWIGFSLADLGEMARASGWFGRARRLLDRLETESAEHGYMLLPEGQRQLGEGDHEGCIGTALEAQRLGERFAEDDLLTLALHMRGRAVLREGRVEEGLALLDQAMVGVISDELSPQVTGIIYCSVISACREVYAHRRAQEWTGALSTWCARQPDMVAYTGECRVYRAEILQRRGAWRDAIEEAHLAAERFFDEPGSSAAGGALYQKAEAHRLLGELAAADEAYRAASRHGREPQPGLALLRMAQGETAVAAAAMRRALSEATDRHRRAHLLGAHVEVMIAAGDLDEAEQACRELAEIAEAWGVGVLSAMVEQSRGAIELASARASVALPRLRTAWHAWQKLDVPYEAARTRALLGRACRALGDEDGARLELEAARAELEALGAAHDVARLDDLAGRPPSREAHGLTPRERQVLAQLATGRTNRAIAKALFISEKTVARHVANIFRKLGLSSRAAATAYAYEHDLQDPPT